MNLKLLFLTVILPSLIGLVIWRVNKDAQQSLFYIFKKKKIKVLSEYFQLYIAYFYTCLLILFGIYLILNFDIGTNKSITESDAFIGATLILALAFLARIETVIREYDAIGVLSLFVQTSFIIIFIRIFINPSIWNDWGTFDNNCLALIENFLIFAKMTLGYIFLGSLGLSIFGEYFIRHELNKKSETKED